MIAGKRF
jgi:hypothetical protein